MNHKEKERLVFKTLKDYGVNKSAAATLSRIEGIIEFFRRDSFNTYSIPERKYGHGGQAEFRVDMADQFRRDGLRAMPISITGTCYISLAEYCNATNEKRTSKKH